MIFGIDEDGIVGASGHAGFATDADRFIEIDDAVRALEHRGRGTCDNARRVRALVTSSDLMRPPRLRENADIDVLDIRARDTDGHDVFRFAGGRAGVTADAPCVVDDLSP